MKGWKKGLIGILIFIVLLVGGIACLLCTTTGLHLVLNSAARWVPGLDIQQVDGGWRNLTLKGVSYKMPGVTVDAGEFHLALRPGCLKQSALCINDLAFKDVNVVVDSKQMPPAAKQPVEEESSTGEISTPYPLTLSRLALHNINVKIDNTAISLADFTSGLHWQERAMTLTPTHIQGLLIALPGRHRWRKSRSHRLKLNNRRRKMLRWAKRSRHCLPNRFCPICRNLSCHLMSTCSRSWRKAAYQRG